jgi:hypothetical protein
MNDLRELARRRWRENDLRQLQYERARRFASAFFFGMALTLLAVSLISTAARFAARPITAPIERSLSHE